MVIVCLNGVSNQRYMRECRIKAFVESGMAFFHIIAVDEGTLENDGVDRIMVDFHICLVAFTTSYRIYQSSSVGDC